MKVGSPEAELIAASGIKEQEQWRCTDDPQTLEVPVAANSSKKIDRDTLLELCARTKADYRTVRSYIQGERRTAYAIANAIRAALVDIGRTDLLPEVRA